MANWLVICGSHSREDKKRLWKKIKKSARLCSNWLNTAYSFLIESIIIESTERREQDRMPSPNLVISSIYKIDTITMCSMSYKNESTRQQVFFNIIFDSFQSVGLGFSSIQDYQFKTHLWIFILKYLILGTQWWPSIMRKTIINKMVMLVI